MTAMEKMQDNAFDLAIVDPPYGIGISKMKSYKNKGKNFMSTFYNPKDWDENIPNSSYFEELKRVSKNQIIFGGNYFTDYLKPTKSWCIWDKVTGDNEFSMFEMIYFSFKIVPKIFKYPIARINNRVSSHPDQVKKTRIHPTQKPVALYVWLLDKYAKNGDRILDTHLGSGSSAIAAHDMDFDFVGYELDKDYFAAAQKRLHEHQKQLKLFVG